MSFDDDQIWRVGRPLRDSALADAVRRIRSAALRLVGAEVQERDPRDFADARHMLVEAFDAVVVALERGGGEQVRLLASDLRTCTELLAAAAQGDWMEATVLVQAALARLRTVETEPELLEQAAQELCRCGFARVMITRVDAEVARVEAAFDFRDPSDGQRVLLRAREMTLRLDSMKLEADMVRRRVPILVQELGGAELHPLLQMTGCRSYVAAPIVSGDRVIGSIHADCYYEQRTVDAHDRDRLMLFAEGLGYIVERLRLFGRLRTLRQEVRRSNASVVAAMGEYAKAPVQLTARRAENSTSDGGSVLREREQRQGSGLTRRERQIMELIAAGHTNARIAADLMLSEQTVRTHVKRILRKLRAGNRAEAVSRWRYSG